MSATEQHHSRARIDRNGINTILNRWWAGEKGQAIADHFGVRKNLINEIVRRARHAGDERAIIRRRSGPVRTAAEWTTPVAWPGTAEWYQNAPWSEHEEAEPERLHEARKAQDEAFCAAMLAAIVSGSERAPIGIYKCDDPFGVPTVIHSPATSSFCTSSAALCMEAAGSYDG